MNLLVGCDVVCHSAPSDTITPVILERHGLLALKGHPSPVSYLWTSIQNTGFLLAGKYAGFAVAKK